MKKLLTIAVALAFLYTPCFANGDTIEKSKPEEQQADGKYKPFECPKSRMTDQNKCFNCHTIPSFKVKECRPDACFDFPNAQTSIKVRSEKKVGHFVLNDITDRQFRQALDYFYHHGIKDIVFTIHSPGGSLFDAWNIVGMLEEAKASGIHIETRVYGMAFSAGFLIFCAGNDRVVTPTAELMWHELITGEMFAIKTPSDKEDESLVLRHLQNTCNNYISSKSRMSKEAIDAKVRKKEFWINGTEAHDIGFATRLIGGK